MTEIDFALFKNIFEIKYLFHLFILVSCIQLIRIYHTYFYNQAICHMPKIPLSIL